MHRALFAENWTDSSPLPLPSFPQPTPAARISPSHGFFSFSSNSRKRTAAAVPRPTRGFFSFLSLSANVRIHSLLPPLRFFRRRRRGLLRAPGRQTTSQLLGWPLLPPRSPQTATKRAPPPPTTLMLARTGGVAAAAAAASKRKIRDPSISEGGKEGGPGTAAGIPCNDFGFLPSSYWNDSVAEDHSWANRGSVEETRFQTYASMVS